MSGEMEESKWPGRSEQGMETGTERVMQRAVDERVWLQK